MANSDILIHVRFAADGSVAEIGERPAGPTAQEWFNLLSRNSGDGYRALAGGRGAFTLSAGQLATLKAALAARGDEDE